MHQNSCDIPIPISVSTDYENAVDIHEICVILNYERGTTEPRFRHTKLREVATTSDFRTIQLLTCPEWNNADRNNRTGMVFERIPRDYQKDSDRDLPTNMVHWDPAPSVRNLTPKQLETYYWQARNHDGCFQTVTLMQHFFDLLPFDTYVRIRTTTKSAVSAKHEPVEYITPSYRRKIVEFHITNSKHLSLAVVLPGGTAFISGGPKSPHAVIGFSRPQGTIDTILDLSSLQYGDVGRGYNGNDFFVLEPMQDYVSNRLKKYGESNTFKTSKISDRIGPAPNDEYLIDVARRAKKRWEDRKQTPFCAYCGAPPQVGSQMARCSICKKESYCNSEHQKNSWSFHKHFCKVVNDALDKSK